MKHRTLRYFALVMAVLLLLPLSACGKRTPKQDTSPLTMYVGLGNTGTGYYEKLRDEIFAATGVKLNFVYSRTLDTTTQIFDCIRSYDLPADIVMTAMAADEEAQKGAFLDLAAYTNVPDLFTTTRVQSLSVDGAVYQLPFTSRLIGIEYNRTLMEEMDWELPESFEDMVALKAKAEAAGYPFAVSGGVATGHGFNYLFHLMGSQYLSTPDGSAWFRGFRSGTESIDRFAAAADYFRRYAEAGLFGSIHTQDWAASNEFCQTRALFYYNIINDTYSYDGFRYNADGTLYGAEYGADGLPKAEKDSNGSVVLLDGSYVLYDPENENHQGLTRYTIPGAQILHDEYGSMPWISENGSSNCYTAYDNMLVGLDKKLGNPDQQQRLADAVKVLTFMATKTATDLFSDLCADGYVALTGFQIDDTRMYRDYTEHIKSGYLANWFYNYFDTDAIVNVGQLVNDYLSGNQPVEFQQILDELVLRNNNYLAGQSDCLTHVEKTLDYPETAALQAAANGIAAQRALEAAGISDEVTVSLLPYVQSAADVDRTLALSVVQSRLYGGDFDESHVSSLLAIGSYTPLILRLTGSEIQELISGGYSALPDFGYDHVFSYACAVKGGASLESDRVYLTAVPKGSLENAEYEAFLAADKVITADGTPITGNMTPVLTELLASADPFSADSVHWK